MKWLWVGLAALFAVAAGATWYAFNDPTFWGGLVAMAIAAFLPVILKRMSPEDEKAWNEFMRSNPDKEEIRRWKKARRMRLRAAKN